MKRNKLGVKKRYVCVFELKYCIEERIWLGIWERLKRKHENYPLRKENANYLKEIQSLFDIHHADPAHSSLFSISFCWAAKSSVVD